jgi:hypothetical protein
MNAKRIAIAVCFAAIASTCCYAASGLAPEAAASSSQPASPAPEAMSSSAAASTEAPAVATEAPAAAMSLAAQPLAGTVQLYNTRPFSAVAVGVKVGIDGIGFDVATPLARKLNLRGGASFFNYNANVREDGIGVSGNIYFRSVNTSVDWFPFGGLFRISPGVIAYNGNRVSATASVPGGDSFTLNSVQYTSSNTSPVTGTFDVAFGNKVAPSLTIGLGNLIPRKGGHFSVSTEIGVEYINAPVLTMNLTGSVCPSASTVNGACPAIATVSTSSAPVQANVQAEQAKLNSDISILRVFPIASIELGYRF